MRARVHYRPPVSHALSTEKEKKRLNELFTHKGGKALPAELLHPIGEKFPDCLALIGLGFTWH